MRHVCTATWATVFRMQVSLHHQHFSTKGISAIAQFSLCDNIIRVWGQSLNGQDTGTYGRNKSRMSHEKQCRTPTWSSLQNTSTNGRTTVRRSNNCTYGRKQSMGRNVKPHNAHLRFQHLHQRARNGQRTQHLHQRAHNNERRTMWSKSKLAHRQFTTHSLSQCHQHIAFQRNSCDNLQLCVRLHHT